jgi:tetratricopeptide (TPR) repeat protein
MNVLWQTVLNNVPPTDKAWVKEVLRWILIANNMSIRDLQSVVEWARRRTFKPEGEFTKFLESECGSLLQLIRLDNGETEARLIHETLRSLLFDQEACKTTFAFDKKAIRCDAVLEFLRRLGEAEKTLPKYLSLNWSHLLSLVAESESLSDKLLSALHQSFVNESWTTWIQLGLIEHGRSTSLLHWGIGFNYPQMHDIVNSLKQWKGNDITELEAPKAAAIKWKQQIIKHPGILDQYVGKAAAKIWLYEDHVKFRNAAMAFYLALKYYLRRERHWPYKNSAKELQELVASKFHGIIIWAGRTERVPRPKNIGIAFAFLRQWDHAITHYQSVSDTVANDDPRLLEYLGNAYHGKGDKDKELDAYKRASKINPKRWRPWAYLSFAYSANSDEKSRILMYEKAVEKDPTRSWPGYKTFIQNQQEPVNHLTDWWPWPYFEGKDYAIRVPVFIRGRFSYTDILVYDDIETDRTLPEKLPETYLEVSGWPEPRLVAAITEKVISSLSLVLIS